MKTCPECSEEVHDDDWDPDATGTGNKPGLCLECAEFFQAEDDLFEEEFEASLRSMSPDVEITEDDGDIV